MAVGKRLRKQLSYLPKVLRLGFFGLTVTAGLVALSARAVAHNVREGLLSFGHEMMRYGGEGATGPERRLLVNGAELHFASGSTTDSVRAVLDVYEGRCAERDGGLAAQVAELNGRGLERSGLAGAASPGRRSPGTMRAGGENQGFVACLDASGARWSTDELLRRLRRFGETGDVSAVGRFRYLYAERAENGRTRFLGFWSDGELNVRRMFPTSGDAPGDDVPNVPRVAGLRRLLVAREQGEPYGMEVFAGSVARERVEQFYREAMVREGWTLIPMRGTAPDLEGQTMLTYERAERSVSLVIDTGREGQTSVTVLAAH